MHYWGDGHEFWDYNHEMQLYIYEQMEKQGYYISMKEKYGSFRYEHIYYKNNKEMAGQMGWISLCFIVGYLIDQYPQFQDELLSNLAVHEELVGKEIHDMYWVTYDGK